METLDNIMSGRGEATSAPENTPETNTTQPDVAVAGQQPDAEPDIEGTQVGADGQKTVPLQALHAERNKAKRYTEQIADFDKRMSETNQAWERRFTQLLETVKPKEQPQAPPDWFENPNEAAMHAVSPHLARMEQVMMANAQLVAGTKYGDDKVQEAEQAFITALQANKLDPADYQRVVNSPNRYAAAVQWHQKQSLLSEVGDDPVAYRAKLEAEILAKHGIQPGTQAAPGAAAPAPVMPSNLAAARNVGTRSGPAYAGPTNLQDIFKR